MELLGQSIRMSGLKIATAGRSAAVAMADQSVSKHTMISETEPLKAYIEPYEDP